MSQPIATGGSIRRVLPDGLSIQVSQTKKTYGWNHATTIGDGDPTLNGLLSFPKNQQPQEERLSRPQTANLGVISEAKAKAISQNYSNLPAILKQAGIGVLDEKREQFIQRASQMKKKLFDIYKGKPIPSAEMQRADSKVNELGFQCVELVIKGFVVTTNNPRGSKQRKSDGKYVTERVLRRVCIDRPLTDQQVKQILDCVCGDLVKSMAREANYTIRSNGRDAGGNPVFTLSLDSTRRIRPPT